MYNGVQLPKECSDWRPIFVIECAVIGEKFSIIVVQLLKHYIRLHLVGVLLAEDLKSVALVVLYY